MNNKFKNVDEKQLTINKVSEIFDKIISDIENQIKLLGCLDTGSTLCGICLNKANNSIYSINVGDSLSVVYNNKLQEIENFNELHNLKFNKSEEKRILDLNVKIDNNRVNGTLAVTRSIGDFAMRKHGVISIPEYKEKKISPNDITIIATDGLFDVLNNSQIKDIILKSSNNNISQLLIKEALSKETKDNVTVIVLIHN